MKKRYLFLLLAGVLSLASCKNNKKNNNNNDNPSGSSGTVTAVSLDKQQMDVIIGKRSSDITVTVTGEGDYDKRVKFVSENENIATASFTEVKDGETFKVYGKGVGDTTIKVVSMADESKAASLAVSVKDKEVTTVSEIQSVSLDRETKLFRVGDAAIDVEVTVHGLGTYDDSVTVSLSENPTVTVSKTSLKSGEKFSVAPTETLGETKITVKSVQDETKLAELTARVEAALPDEDPIEKVLELDCLSHKLVERGSDFRVSAYAQGGEVAWSWKEDDATDFVGLRDGANNSGATVYPVAPTPEGKKATLVAKLMVEEEAVITKECVFTVDERAKDIQTYYVSNNGYLNYSEIYFYAWNEAGGVNADWPGEHLTESVKNTNGEDCYKFEADILEYTNFKFNNGLESTDPGFKETAEGAFAAFGYNNNVWFDEDGNIHYAVLQMDVETVDFGIKKNYSIYNGEQETFHFTSRKGTPEAEITSGSDYVEIVGAVGVGSITLRAKAVGVATVKVFIPDTNPGDPNLAEDEITVTVLDATNIKKYYFTNNKGWENVYLYTWNNDTETTQGDHNDKWPGVQLHDPLKNGYGQDVYEIFVDTTRWSWMVLNNGAGEQTVDIDFTLSQFESNNNIYPDSSESPYDIDFANFVPLAVSVAFAEDSVTVYEDVQKSVHVTTTGGSGVVYNITSGSDKVAITSSSDDHVTLKWLQAGSATIVASLNGAEDATLQVTCEAGVAPANNKTYYFWNSYTSWTDFSLYLFNSSTGSSSDEWPGLAFTGPTVASTSGKECYEVEVNLNAYDSFILTGKEGESLKQTRDVAFSEFDIEDMFSFATDKPWIQVGEDKWVADIVAGEFGHIHSYDPTTHLCSCGQTDPNYEELVTLRFSNNIGADEIVVKAWSGLNTPDFSGGFINSTSSYVNHLGQTVYAFSVNKLAYDYVSFVDKDQHSSRTVAIDISSATDTSCWYAGELEDGLYTVGTWTYEPTRTIYLNANMWDADNAVMFLHYWDDTNSVAAVDVKMTVVDAEHHIYSAEMPTEANQLLFVRMPAGSESVNWDTKWNQSPDLAFYDNAMNQYNIENWDNSGNNWSHYGA